MAVGREPEVESPDGSAVPTFLSQICLPHLRDTQNPDGGWGFCAGASSSVEATSWSLLGLVGLRSAPDLDACCERALAWTGKAQLADGSWPAYPGQRHGCWVTSLASLALLAHDTAPERVAKGAKWLCNSWPGEGGWWWRFRHRLFAKPGTVRQDFSLRGWSWTPGTSSWVEPTSLALLLLQRAAGEPPLPLAAKRIQLAEAMLYDRVCPGGGWNCGNPLVYGVPGEPAVMPTALALMALRAHSERNENRQSLDWLESTYPRLQGPGSLALAHLSLALCDRPAPEPELEAFYRTNQFLGNTAVLAWAAMALGPARFWFRESLFGKRPS